MSMLSVLIVALIAVESGGDPTAVGDNGQAIGVLQIHREVVADVNRVYGLNYTHDQMKQPAKARQVAALYLQHYGKVYERRTGRKATMEVLSRCWNGGPSGWRKDSTLPYWEKVRHKLQWQRAPARRLFLAVKATREFSGCGCTWRVPTL